METKAWTYEEYPEFTMEEAGIIPTTGDEVRIRYIPDVEYAVVDGIPLHLQILYPATRNTPEPKLPCVLHVQGSGWRPQDVYKAIPSYSKLAERGFVVAIVQYRHFDQASFPAPILDTKNAVRFLRANADRFFLDPERMFLSGDSSGGHTAVFTRFIEGAPEDNLFPGVSDEVLGILDYYGCVSIMRDDANPTTLDHHLPTSPEGHEAGWVDLRENTELRREMSFEGHLGAETPFPPTLIFHGSKDRTVNPAVSGDFYRALIETGHEARIYLLQGADHGGSEFWMPEVVDIAEAFLRELIARADAAGNRQQVDA
ncbi:MAG: alpha/beta hydrolase [Atopobiaceae bacterium]|nr:alpha/beta hydrolase [Atopobiaceae bacterium]